MKDLSEQVLMHIAQNIERRPNKKLHVSTLRRNVLKRCWQCARRNCVPYVILANVTVFRNGVTNEPCSDKNHMVPVIIFL